MIADPKKKRRLRFLAVTAALIVALMFCGWWWRAPLLKGLGRVWIVNEELAQADAIVLLGGGIETRSVVAARLYHEGWAKQILVMQPERTKITKLDLIADQAALTKKLLLVENVPESAIVFVEPEVTSTFEEAQALNKWAKDHQAHLLLAPTDLFHTRRARWILQRYLKDSGAEVRMIAVPLKRYNGDNWWQTEQGLIDFQNEIIKFALYKWRY